MRDLVERRDSVEPGHRPSQERPGTDKGGGLLAESEHHAPFNPDVRHPGTAPPAQASTVPAAHAHTNAPIVLQ